MKKICLTVVGLYIMLLHAFSQVSTKDSSAYKSKPLKVEEINLVSSYYTQNGDHSPVTGGIGMEKVTDLANGLELKLVGWDGKQRKNSLIAGLGIDYHTAASQAFVDPKGTTKNDGIRIYPSIDWSIENQKRGTGFGLGAYYSTEFNYRSFGVNTSFSKKTKTNGEFSSKLSGYLTR